MKSEIVVKPEYFVENLKPSLFLGDRKKNIWTGVGLYIYIYVDSENDVRLTVWFTIGPRNFIFYPFRILWMFAISANPFGPTKINPDWGHKEKRCTYINVHRVSWSVPWKVQSCIIYYYPYTHKDLLQHSISPSVFGRKTKVN